MKFFPNHFFSLLIMLSLAMTASSCSGGKQPAPETEVPTLAASADVSPTVRASNTARPSPTITPTSTATPVPSTTPSPTMSPPPDDFSQIEFLSYGPLPNWEFIFTFQFPSAVEGEYFVETKDPRKIYPCRPLLEYNHPERLVCLGRVPAVEKNVDFTIKDANTGAVLYSNRIAVPFY